MGVSRESLLSAWQDAGLIAFASLRDQNLELAASQGEIQLPGDDPDLGVELVEMLLDAASDEDHAIMTACRLAAAVELVFD